MHSMIGLLSDIIIIVIIWILVRLKLNNEIIARSTMKQRANVKIKSRYDK